MIPQLDLVRRPRSRAGGGTSPTSLVLTHGWACDSSIWKLVVPLLDAFDLAWYDTRGFGDSEGALDDPERWSLDLAAGDLAAALASCGAGGRIAVGHSMSGAAALRLAACGTEPLAGVVTIGANPRPVRGEDWEFGFGPEEARGALALLRGSADFASALVGLLRASGLPEPEPLVVEEAEEVLAASARAVRLPEIPVRILERFLEIDLRGLLSEVRAPVLLIHGERDAMSPPALGEWMATRLPRAELVVVPGAGHYPQLTRPAFVARAIETFAAKLG